MASKPQRWPEVPDRTIDIDHGSHNWLAVRCKRVWQVLEFSSAYLALIAMAEVVIVMALLSLSPSAAPLVAGLITFAIYANDRLIDLDTDSESNPKRTEFVSRHRETLYILAALAYGLGVALAVLGGPVAFGLAVLPGLAWIVYARDWLPAGDTEFTRLKEVLFVNSLIVATAWSIPIVAVPVVFADASFTPAAGVLVLYFFIGTFINVEIANAEDIRSDTQSGAVTMPVVFGLTRTRRSLYALTALSALLLGYAAARGYLTDIAAAILATGLVALTGVLSLVGRIEHDGRLTVAAECTRLPVFLLLVVPSLVG